VATLTGLVAACSGFMNNVGALALFMPVAVWMSRRAERSPSFLLMPIAFGSLLGGALTLIGTPPNIIVASYRREVAGDPFGMFAFMPVGLAVVLIGLSFIALVGWRLTPKRKGDQANEELFEISSYLTELAVPQKSKFVNRSLHDLAKAVEDDAEVVLVGLVRNGKRQELPSTFEVLREGDILLVEADPDSLKTALDVTGLELAAKSGPDEEAEKRERGDAGEGDSEARSETPGKSDLSLAEAIVAPGSVLIGKTARALDLRERYGVNALAVARQGERLKERLDRIRFAAGDILLIQAREEALASALSELGCLPLASRGLRIAQPRKVLLASLLFATALALVAVEILAPATALVAGAAAMVLAKLIPPSEVYKSIDMPVIVLLAAMLPVGEALEATGGSRLIADGLLEASQELPAAATLAALMGAVMLLSNVVNNAAAAILAAPVAISLARGMDASPDPFLMAVAVGASCAFLTPIGHQSNTLVMEPGGYRFGDYWRMGLPLSVLVVAVAVPTIQIVWPL